MNYFKQKIKEVRGLVGDATQGKPDRLRKCRRQSSASPIAIFEHLSAKLPISRLQSGSHRLYSPEEHRCSAGLHTFVALKSLLKGIEKLELNKKAIDDDLSDNWAEGAEAIQTILRKEGYPNPYEALKELTRKNEKITKESIMAY